MTERQFQIAFERGLQTAIPEYYSGIVKLDSDTIFHYINKAKDTYVKTLYSQFQYNQRVDDSLRTLVKTGTFNPAAVTTDEFSLAYPKDYLFTLGENVQIYIYDNPCENLQVKKHTDVIEATIETLSRQLENSLSEHRLHHNQARPIRVHKDNEIYFYTDGTYGIKEYQLTYLIKAKDLGTNLSSEYTDLPEHTHQEIVDAAVAEYLQTAALMRSGNTDKQ